MHTRRLLAPIALVLVLVLAAAVHALGGSQPPARAVSAEVPPDVGVSVEAVGTASAPPDVLRVSLGAEATAPTVQEALDEANAATRRMIDALRSAGVAERDIQTAGLQLHPRYDVEPRPEANGEQITGYVARQDLAVTLRDLAEAGTTISAAVEAGGNAARLSGMSFALEDDAAVQAQAREEAFAAARRKAEQYAELAGRELGEVVSVREQTSPSGPGPVFYEAEAARVAADSVPVAPGVTEVTVSTQVRWSLE